MIERSRVRISPCWNGGRIFFSGVDFRCWLLFRYPFHSRVTTVARKKSRSFCQKCRWQVTAKTRIHLTYVAFTEPCFGIGHNLSLICQMTLDFYETLDFYFKRLWFVDTVLWLCPSLPTETLKWLSSLPILMQESFWWWQCSDRYIISLFPHLHTPFPPPSPRPW